MIAIVIDTQSIIFNPKKNIRNISSSKSEGSIENMNKGITCNSIQLGYFDGGMTYAIPEKIIEKVKDNIPLKRFGNISELHNTVNYIINTPYITGTSIKINGGLAF